MNIQVINRKRRIQIASTQVVVVVSATVPYQTPVVCEAPIRVLGARWPRPVATRTPLPTSATNMRCPRPVVSPPPRRPRPTPQASAIQTPPATGRPSRIVVHTPPIRKRLVVKPVVTHRAIYRPPPIPKVYVVGTAPIQGGGRQGRPLGRPAIVLRTPTQIMPIVPPKPRHAALTLRPRGGRPGDVQRTPGQRGAPGKLNSRVMGWRGPSRPQARPAVVVRPPTLRPAGPRAPVVSQAVRQRTPARKATRALHSPVSQFPKIFQPVVCRYATKRRNPPAAIVGMSRAQPTALPPRPIIVRPAARRPIPPRSTCLRTPAQLRAITPTLPIVPPRPAARRLPPKPSILSSTGSLPITRPIPTVFRPVQPRRLPPPARVVKAPFVRPSRVQPPIVAAWPPRAKRPPVPPAIVRMTRPAAIRHRAPIVVAAPRLRRPATIQLAIRPQIKSAIVTTQPPRPVVVRPPLRRLPPASRWHLVRTPWTAAGLPPDMPAAAMRWLRNYPGVAAAFGDDPGSPATTKFQADQAEGLPGLPYAVYEEIAEDLEREGEDADGSAVSYGDGMFQIRIVAAGKRQARDLGRLVAKTLKDAPLTFQDGVLEYLRLGNHYWDDDDAGDIGPGSATQYEYVLEFKYIVVRVDY